MKSEYEFIMTAGSELGKHLGQWVVIVGDKIVAHGDDAKLAYDKVKKLYPKETPFIIKIPKEPIMLL